MLIFQHREDFEIILKIKMHHLIIPALLYNQQGFLWIHAFQTKYNFESNRLIQSVYNLSQTTRGFHECDDYDLGKEFFNGLEINNLYLEVGKFFVQYLVAKYINNKPFFPG